MTPGTRLWYEWSMVRIVDGTKSPDTLYGDVAVKIATVLFLWLQLL